MKLSFSTKGWHDSTFEEFCQVAGEMRFEGIELHNIYNRLFTDKDGAFHDYTAAVTRRRLYENGLRIPCIDTICDVADAAVEEQAAREIERCLEIAANLNIPCIRLRAAASMLLSSYITMPAVTLTLSECLVPYCGISMQPSAISTTSCCTPKTSCPMMIAVFCCGGNCRSLSMVAPCACSMA